jgi:hypothetical protein
MVSGLKLLNQPATKC